MTCLSSESENKRERKLSFFLSDLRDYDNDDVMRSTSTQSERKFSER